MSHDENSYDRLIGQVDDLIRRARDLQLSGDEADETEFRKSYLSWYSAALPLVPEADLETFKDRYEGGSFVTRIRGFLNNPRRESPLKLPPSDGDSQLEISPFANPVETTFVDNIRRQQEILSLANDHWSETQHEVTVQYVAQHLERLGGLLRSLRQRHENRDPYLVNDEYDLQDLILGVLRLFDEDTEPEDFAPKMAGTGSRLDWIMRTLEIAVEAKFCRSRDPKRKVRDELLADLGTFESHPKAKGFIAVVFDPEETIDNPVGFIRDLEDHGNKILPTRIVLITKH